VRTGHPLLRHGTASVLGTAPLTVLVLPSGPGEGPDDALLLALNPTDDPLPVHLPADQPRRWIRFLDSASGVSAAPGEALPGGETSFELRGRSVVLLGLPAARVG
jgi:hypothetical protein